MSGHRPARRRLIAASVLALVAALATLIVIVTVRYRDGLEQRLRTDLTSGASALRTAGTPAALKSVTASLAAEGISVDFAGITAKGGSVQATPGEGLLTVHELIRVDDRDLHATLTASHAGIDRQVHSLEVTEAIGGRSRWRSWRRLRASSCYSIAPPRRRARLRQQCERSWQTPHTSFARQSPRSRRPPSGSCEINRRARRATRSKPNSRVTAAASGT